MKRKAAIVGIVAVSVVAAACCFILFSEPRGDVDTAKLMMGLQRYAADQRAAGVELPREISIRELEARGYLLNEDVRGFEGMEVEISLSPDETRSSGILVRARLPDGTVEAVMGDGSVQQVR